MEVIWKEQTQNLIEMKTNESKYEECVECDDK